MDAIIVTIPIREEPTRFPPIGSLSLMTSLRKAGIEDIELFNIDFKRPSFNKAVSYITKKNPRVIGISAVVSTSYSYVKNLVKELKLKLPNAIVVIGGSMAASAEILLKKANVDICVNGEGEITFTKIVLKSFKETDLEKYRDIPGLVFLNKKGNVINTGYENQISAEDVYDVDWNDLSESSDLSYFILDTFEDGKCNQRFSHDKRSYENHRKKKTIASLAASKGCVARCTFCHRFTKGIRYIPIKILRERIEYLINNHSVGFLEIVDENFGTSKKWLEEFCELMGDLDFLWYVAGMRVNCASPEKLKLMYDSGCVSALFGMETGSEKMLQVMEKKVKLEDNYNTAQWLSDAGLSTGLQLIVGMPGETTTTIKETINFAKFATTRSSKQNPNHISINYAQALPGTPLYSYARHNGMIGKSIEAEEDYLIHISDKNAADEFNTLNFTDLPKLICLTWRGRIMAETNYHYVKKFGLNHYYKILSEKSDIFWDLSKISGYINNPMYKANNVLPSIWSLVLKKRFGYAAILYPKLFYKLRHFLIFMVLLQAFSSNKIHFREVAHLIYEYAFYKLNFVGRFIKSHNFDYISLRKYEKKVIGVGIEDNIAVKHLRDGR